MIETLGNIERLMEIAKQTVEETAPAALANDSILMSTSPNPMQQFSPGLQNSFSQTPQVQQLKQATPVLGQPDRAPPGIDQVTTFNLPKTHSGGKGHVGNDLEGDPIPEPVMVPGHLHANSEEWNQVWNQQMQVLQNKENSIGKIKQIIMDQAKALENNITEVARAWNHNEVEMASPEMRKLLSLDKRREGEAGQREGKESGAARKIGFQNEGHQSKESSPDRKQHTSRRAQKSGSSSAERSKAKQSKGRDLLQPPMVFSTVPVGQSLAQKDSLNFKRPKPKGDSSEGVNYEFDYDNIISITVPEEKLGKRGLQSHGRARSKPK